MKMFASKCVVVAAVTWIVALTTSAWGQFGAEDVSQPKVHFHECGRFGPIEAPVHSALDLAQGGTLEFSFQRTWKNPLWNQDENKESYVCVLSNNGQIKTREPQNESYYTCRWAVHVNERNLFFQVGEQVRRVNLFDENDSVEALVSGRSPVQVFLAVTASEEKWVVATYVYATDNKKLSPREVVELTAPTEPNGVLRAGSYDGKNLNFPGLLGGVRIWSQPYTLEAVRDLVKYGQQHVERGIQPRRLNANDNLRFARRSDLVAYSNFAGDPGAVGVKHRIVTPHRLEGNWVNVLNHLPVPDAPLPNLNRAFGNFSNVELFTVVRTGPTDLGVYRDGALVGYFIDLPEKKTIFVARTGDSYHDLAFDEDNADQITVSPAPGVLLGPAPPSGGSVQLMRPEPLLKGDSDPVDASSSFERAAVVKYFTANCRAFNIAFMNPEIYYEDASTGTQSAIFAYPGKGDYRNTPDTKAKTIPNLFHLVQLNETEISRTSQMITTVDEFASMYSARIGANVGVPGASGAPDLCNFSMNASFQQSSSNVKSKTGVSVFSEGWVRNYALVLDKAHIRLNPGFLQEVSRLADGSNTNWDAFITKWGTHYPYAVTYGGLMSYEQEMTEEGIKESLKWGFDIEAAQSMSVPGTIKGGRSAGFGTEQSEAHEKLFRSDRSKVRFIGESSSISVNPENASFSFTEPVPIYMDLRPLYELLSPAYFDDPRIYHDLRATMKQKHDAYMKAIAAKRERGEPVAKMTTGNRRVSEKFEIVATTMSNQNPYEEPEYYGALDITAQIRQPKIGPDGKALRDGGGDIIYEWVNYQPSKRTKVTYPEKLWEAFEDEDQARMRDGEFSMKNNEKDKPLPTRWNAPKKYQVELMQVLPEEDANKERAAANPDQSYSNPDSFRLRIDFDATEIDDDLADKNDQFVNRAWLVLPYAPSPAIKAAYLKEGYTDVFVFTEAEQEQSLQIQSEKSFRGDYEYLSIKVKFSKVVSDDPWKRKLGNALKEYQDQIVAREPKLGPKPVKVLDQKPYVIAERQWKYRGLVATPDGPPYGVYQRPVLGDSPWWEAIPSNKEWSKSRTSVSEPYNKEQLEQLEQLAKDPKLPRQLPMRNLLLKQIKQVSVAIRGLDGTERVVKYGYLSDADWQYLSYFPAMQEAVNSGLRHTLVFEDHPQAPVPVKGTVIPDVEGIAGFLGRTVQTYTETETENKAAPVQVKIVGGASGKLASGETVYVRKGGRLGETVNCFPITVKAVQVLWKIDDKPTEGKVHVRMVQRLPDVVLKTIYEGVP